MGVGTVEIATLTPCQYLYHLRGMDTFDFLVQKIPPVCIESSESTHSSQKTGSVFRLGLRVSSLFQNPDFEGNL